MWILTLRSPTGEPREFNLKAGATTIGRKSDNDIVITDESASRYHAEIQCSADTDILVIRDLDSTNGTFVNRERLAQAHVLRPEDQIRIGQDTATVSFQENDQTAGRATAILSGTQPLTRDLLLESLDQHAVLLYEVASRLNTIVDSDSALHEIARLMQTSMGAEKCEVIRAEHFGRLADLGFPTSVAHQAIDQRSAVVIPDMSKHAPGRSALLLRVRSALCVPIMIGDEVAALIYVYKTNPASRPFDQNDVRLAVAISHQAAMTIQRTRLLKRLRQADRISHLFQRFLSPPEAEFLLQEYQRTGKLPELSEQILTVLFADMRDSTALAERLGARRFGEILSRYYLEMTTAVFDHNGLLNKYLGDGIMAVFGALGQPEPETRAVRTALEMLDRMGAISRAVGEDTALGIGINTGVVVAGYVGTDERVEYTVLGDAVNIAQRLERHARNNQIYIGPDTCQAVIAHFKTRSIGSVEVRGRTQPIDAFEILPR
ncbi:MAG TPA: adenylate/guanylate cyclase domain-containing protein [Anaerolineales bacterium]|nr:adenylate/guanylate cyclase domain-containing protein [Anaerolineales bacterium]